MRSPALLLSVVIIILIGISLPLILNSRSAYLTSSSAAPFATPEAAVAARQAVEPNPESPQVTPPDAEPAQAAADGSALGTKTEPVDASSPAVPLTTLPSVLQATATPAPLRITIPTPSASLDVLATRLVLEADFSSLQPGWPNDPSGTAWFAADGYHLFARQPGQFVSVAAPLREGLRNVRVEATFKKLGGPPGGSYGLILRDDGPGALDGKNQGGRYYVVCAADNSQVGAWRREHDHWDDLLAWTRSAAVQPDGQTNRLSAQAVGEHLTFAVNGMQVLDVTDAELRQGGVGIFAGGDLNAALVQNFAAYALE
jgi:hypothetical protein